MGAGGGSTAGAFTGGGALLAVTALALAASATVGEPEREPAAAGADATSPTPAAIERRARRLTPRVARRVERIRGLSFERVPRPRVITGERFAAITAHEADRDRELEAELAETEAAARLLGLMSASEQLDALAAGAPDLAAAAWDTRRERLYVIADASGDDAALLEFLLAHELDHALEDQRFGLGEPKGLGDDAALARLALIEGSATAVMIEYGGRHINPLELAAAGAGLDPGTEGVPRFFVESLTWAYLRGAEFIGALREASAGWEPVDEALAERPPASSEQIMHPRAYLRRERPAAVDLDAEALGARGWRVLDRGELGEFTTGQLLRVGAPPGVAARGAAGWGGDAYALLGRDRDAGDCTGACRRELALAVEWRWDSAGEAREFARVLPAYLVGGLAARPRGPGTWAVDGGWIASASAGETVRLGFAPSERLAELAASGAAPGRG